MNLPELAAALLTQTPDITGFYHWHLFTDKPVPERHNLESNEDYVRRNWWRLKRKVVEWQEIQKAIPTP